MRTRRYSGNGRDTKSNGEGIKKLVDLCRRRWHTECLGIYANRDKRGKPGNLSVHALWRACDLRFPSLESRLQACVWLVQYNHELKIDCIVDYAYDKRDKLGRKAYGRSWRCDTQEWVRHKKGDLMGGGQAWADFLHIELGYGTTLAYMSTEKGSVFEDIWRRLPKP